MKTEMSSKKISDDLLEELFQHLIDNDVLRIGNINRDSVSPRLREALNLWRSGVTQSVGLNPVISQIIYALELPFKEIPLRLNQAVRREKAVYKFRLEKGF